MVTDILIFAVCAASLALNAAAYTALKKGRGPERKEERAPEREAEKDAAEAEERRLREDRIKQISALMDYTGAKDEDG